MPASPKGASKAKPPAKSAAQNIFDLLDVAPPDRLPAIIAMVGDDRFLKQLLVRHLESASQAKMDNFEAEDRVFTRMNSDHAWSDVADELATVSLFSSGPRRVLIDEADSFVSSHRRALEDYAERPPQHATLMLDLKALPANQILYKRVAHTGWIVVCGVPETVTGRNRRVDTPRLFQWLSQRAEQTHQIQLTKGAAKLLVELVEWNFGRLDQELAKLALFVRRHEKVSAELVAEVVGGWRTETTWEMLDAAADGDAASALRQLDHLLQSGENPLALFGSLSWSLRRFGVAARLHAEARRRGQSPDVSSLVRTAGFYANQSRAEAQLKQIGKARAAKIFHWLLELDLALKGSHSSPSRARWAFERLLIQLSKQADSRKSSA